MKRVKTLSLLLIAIFILLQTACSAEHEHEFSNGVCKRCGYTISFATFSHEVYGVGVNEEIILEPVGGKDVKSVKLSSSSEHVFVDSANKRVVGLSVGVAEIEAQVSYSEGFSNVIKCRVEVNDGRYENLNLQENLVRWVGRNFANEQGVNFFNTASGFETVFYGTSLTAQLISAGFETPRICVLIDDESIYDAKIIDLSKDLATQNVVLASDLAQDFHTVKVYKITEAFHNAVAIKWLETDGYFHTKTQEKPLKMEVYGDSISTGIKNLRPNVEEGGNDMMQNGCLTYAWLAAQELGYEISVMAREGIGMVWSWGANYFMTDAYKQTYCSEINRLNNGNYNPEWNFSSYKADVVIINVGTNDYWGGCDILTYEERIASMCDELTKAHGEGVKIILCYGMMINDNGVVMQKIADSRSNVYSLKLDASAGNHPRVSDHEVASTSLVKFIKENF